MTSEEFAFLVRAEKDDLLSMYLRPDGESAAGALIAELKLSPAQAETLHEILDIALTDAFYTLLLALDGSTSIGGVQQTYKVLAPDGSLLSECGDLEAAAWEAFHGKDAV